MGMARHALAGHRDEEHVALVNGATSWRALPGEQRGAASPGPRSAGSVAAGRAGARARAPLLGAVPPTRRRAYPLPPNARDASARRGRPPLSTIVSRRDPRGTRVDIACPVARPPARSRRSMSWTCPLPRADPPPTQSRGRCAGASRQGHRRGTEAAGGGAPAPPVVSCRRRGPSSSSRSRPHHALSGLPARPWWPLPSPERDRPRRRGRRVHGRRPRRRRSGRGEGPAPDARGRHGGGLPVRARDPGHAAPRCARVRAHARRRLRPRARRCPLPGDGAAPGPRPRAARHHPGRRSPGEVQRWLGEVAETWSSPTRGASPTAISSPRTSSSRSATTGGSA